MKRSKRENPDYRMERIVYGADRHSAKKLMRVFLKILSKDKKSDGIGVQYTYHPLRRKAEYAIEGHVKTIAKCVKAFAKFVRKQETAAAKAEAMKWKAQPMAMGKYYTMKSGRTPDKNA